MASQGIVRFLKDDQGLEMVEWAVVGVLACRRKTEKGCERLR